jgi:hypothetical protein
MVAAASASGMLRKMLPHGAEPKPNGPLNRLSLMLMIAPLVRSRGACQPSFPLTFSKRFGWTPHPTCGRS